MSTEANAALAWPVEVTEFAVIGNQLAARKKTPLGVVQFWAFLERGKDLPQAPDDQKQGTPLTLCGTAVPGDVWFSYPDTSAMPAPLAQAGFYLLPDNVMRLRPFVGDPRMDPTVLIEGCWAPWEQPPFFWGVDEPELENTDD